MAYKLYAVCVLLACVLLAGVPLSQGKESCGISLLEAVLEHPDLGELAIVFKEAGLSAILDDVALVTLFAPNNNAFNGSNGLFNLLGFEDTSLSDFLVKGRNKVASILDYHVVPSPYNASELTNGQRLTTELSPYTLTVSVDGSKVVIIGGASNATIVIADIQICGAVMHSIDAVLLPTAI
ncbi:hypothetical protein CY35_04G118200 [Sphagnum magellanicum]|nr:hypothetical protein CY35_04G118200 [Sphagnum magellanicum]